MVLQAEHGSSNTNPDSAMTNASASTSNSKQPLPTLQRRWLLGALVGSVALVGCHVAQLNVPPTPSTTKERTTVKLTQEWDKTFPKSEKVDHQKVTFKNRYGITLAADLYQPKNRQGPRLAALAVGGPFGAVKEQSSGLYAQT